jgi:NitT/TauT family transport system ATP-binding protein
MCPAPRPSGLTTELLVNSVSAMLDVRSVKKHVRIAHGRNLPVIGGVSFCVHAGEVVCILGESGCGKTTLLNILAGLEFPSSGQVERSTNSSVRETGYMLQQDSLLPWRTAEENVALALELSSSQYEPGSAKASLAAVGLAGFDQVYPSRLSGGMRQRVALARVLAPRPRLLLLDEPLAHVDVPARRRLSRAIRTYACERPAATVVVTHSVEDAVFLGDRVLILSPRPATIITEFILAPAQDHGRRDHAVESIPRDGAFDRIVGTLLRESTPTDRDYETLA